MDDTAEDLAKSAPLPQAIATELLRFIELSSLHDCAGPAAEQRLAAAVSLLRPADRLGAH